MSALPSPLAVERHAGIAVLTLDAPPVNALSTGVRTALLAAFRTLEADPKIRAIVLCGTGGRFIAGADIKEMERAPEAPLLPEVIAAIEAMSKPVIAALDGPALGGGLEIALACDLRLASPRAMLGLTETRLGLIPGAGGTQRLTRLVGVADAIRLICEGRILTAAAAADLGLVDEVVSTEVRARALALAPRAVKRRLSQQPVPPADAAAVDAAQARALKAGKGVPAIAAAIAIIRAAGDGPFAAGLARERAAFLRLRESAEAQALRHLFLAERAAARLPELDGIAPRQVQHLAVIGAGTMGAGIALACADAGLAVSVVERDAAAAQAGVARIAALYDAQVRSGRLAPDARDDRLARLSVGHDWSVLRTVDLAIEATFEDLAAKEAVFAHLDADLPAGAIIASNTSYLDLDALAALTRRPDDVVGLHFFAPAHIMRLVEIVRGRATAPDVLATALRLARTLGKQPVVAGNGPGFIGNRIYAAYRRQAEILVEDGAAPDEVDAALEAFGFAMGIFAVSDLSGLDIAYAMRRQRDATRDPAERYVHIADRLCEAGRLGRKSGAGWYAYDADGRRQPDPAVAALIAAERARKGIVPRAFAAEEIQHRLLRAMAEEGAQVLAESIAQRASDIDVVFANGYGFPRAKGGPLWAAARLGL